MRSKSSSCKFILLGEWRRQKRCTPGTEQRVCNSIRVLIPFPQIRPCAETGLADGVYAVNTCFVSLYPNKYDQLNHQHSLPLRLRALSTAFRDLWPGLWILVSWSVCAWFGFKGHMIQSFQKCLEKGIMGKESCGVGN